MNLLQAVILGIIQGLSEFLPISSSGHLVLFQNIFNITENPMLFDVILHLGTLIPICIVFHKDILNLIVNPFQKMTLLIILATIPAVVFTLLFEDFIDKLFQGGIFLGCGFIFTGFLLIFADKATSTYKKDKDIAFKDALIIGSMQALAIPPSISRSGCTIAGSLACGLSRETAAKFSFLISIPVILGATVLQLKDIFQGEVLIDSIGVTPMIFGFVASALSGYLSIKFMLKLIKAYKLKYFSYYVFALGLFILADKFFLHIFYM